MKPKKGYRSKYRPEYPATFVFDYKDPLSLTRFLMEAGKIVPSRVSKLGTGQQRALTKAIKKARHIALLPQGNLASDKFRNPEQISPVPFEY